MNFKEKHDRYMTNLDNSYQEAIRTQLAMKGYLGQYDPRHIEAYMRIEHGCLDSLSKDHFNMEVEICRQCVAADGPTNAESLAKSYGL